MRMPASGNNHESLPTITFAGAFCSGYSKPSEKIASIPAGASVFTL